MTRSLVTYSCGVCLAALALGSACTSGSNGNPPPDDNLRMSMSVNMWHLRTSVPPTSPLRVTVAWLGEMYTPVDKVLTPALRKTIEQAISLREWQSKATVLFTTVWKETGDRRFDAELTPSAALKQGSDYVLTLSTVSGVSVGQGHAVFRIGTGPPRVADVNVVRQNSKAVSIGVTFSEPMQAGTVGAITMSVGGAALTGAAVSIDGSGHVLEVAFPSGLDVSKTLRLSLAATKARSKANAPLDGAYDAAPGGKDFSLDLPLAGPERWTPPQYAAAP